MYIPEIDEILNETINNFMGTWILEAKVPELLDFKKLTKEPNFVKYQKDINNILEFGKSLINERKINNLVTKKQNVILVNNVILKYIAYYLFILIGINYNSKIELFNNNLVEFSRNQVNYPIKIDNFFNSESNANIIKVVNLIQEFIDYIEKISSGKNKENDLLDKYSFSLREFVLLIGDENIKKNVAPVLTKEKNKIIVDHSVILMIIQLVLYKDKEKNEIFELIESAETSSGDFIFIDVVVPRSDFIDFRAIEGVLSPSELQTNLPETIYEYLNEDYTDDLNEKRKYFSDHDIKIQKLLDTHVIIPIVDDFLLYHKDNEKYEKQGDKLESPKKKDETKIKYIINKINTASEYYKNPDEIKKLFYLPLQEQNAVLVNTYEDVKILHKMKNIISKSVENIDFINDLISYKMYPYISFKDFKHNGFVFSSEKTIDAIRNVSLDYINKRKYDTLQTRVISDNMLVNIVGFAIINKKETELDCINLNSFIDITKNTNEPLGAIKTLINHKIKTKILNKEELAGTEELNNNYYWLFDLSKQKYSIPFYDISDSMPKNEIIKIVVSYLYDYMIESIISIIRDKFKNSHPKLITQYIDTILTYKHLYPDIENQQHSKELNELEYLVYYVKSIKSSDTYDYNEDEFPGLYGTVRKLPSAPPKKYPKIPVLTVNPDFADKDLTLNKEIVVKEDQIEQADYNSGESTYVNAICQHTITWDKLNELRKQTDFKYSTLVYEFIQQYVDVSADQDYICKSCKSSINIKKYIQDGQFDNNTQNFVSFSIQMDVNIEDLPEYEKFKTSIRNIDKIIERIASIFNLQSLKGSMYMIRTKRRNIVKDTIDIATVHNAYLRKHYLSKRETIIKNYGINKNLSNFFIFELDNSIFVYSSKDKDYYKMIKYNNMLTYILILLILEINDSQIMGLTNDKHCSYYIFKKIGFSLFENLKIINNRSGDLVPINEYPILCYVIYLTSCLMTKYNIWVDIITNEPKSTDKNKFGSQKVLLQKSIINTFVEILNTILSVDVEEMKQRKDYIYEVLQTKYYFKQELYKSTELLRKLDKAYLQITDAKSDKSILSVSTKYDIVPTNSVFNVFEFDDLYNRFSRKFSLQRYVCKFYKSDIAPITTISNLTNCIDGEFHNFKLVDKAVACTKCGELADPYKLIPDSIKILYQREIILYLRKLATKYCITGQVHKFAYNSEKDISVCSNCNYVLGTPIGYGDKELMGMYNKIEKDKKDRNFMFEEYVNGLKIKDQNEVVKMKKIFDKIMYKYQKNDNDITKSISNMLDSVQKLLGMDIVVGNKVYNLQSNIYVIDHDYNGVKLESPIQVYEKENKFRIIESHPHYKRSVIVYTMQKNTKYELFYDLQEKYLLGYREVNKEYNDIDSKNIDVKLEINYSIKNILLLFGLTRQQVNITDFYPEIYGMTQDEFNSKFKENKNFKMSEFVNKICARRFNLIKKLGYELNKYINRFKYNYTVTLITTEYVNPNTEQTNIFNEPSNNPLDILYTKYQKKLDSDIITESVGDKGITHIFLKYMNDILTYFPFSFKVSKNDELKFSETIDEHYIIKNDNTSNIILNYILDEIDRIINYNTNKTVKTNVIHFIIDSIVTLFNQYNREIMLFNKSLNQFNQILYTSEFYLETQSGDLMVDAIDYYSNQHTLTQVNEMDDEQRTKVIDEMEDDVEEAEAMDIGDEILDEEGRFDHYSNYDFIDNIKEFISEGVLPPGDYY